MTDHPDADSSNPYRAPTVAETVDSGEQARLKRFATLGKVIVGWERLRLLYNVFLGLWTLLVILANVTLLSNPVRLTSQIVAGALLANLLFCAGHLADGYMTWFGFGHRVVTISLFISGTLLSMYLAMLILTNGPF